MIDARGCLLLLLNICTLHFVLCFSLFGLSFHPIPYPFLLPRLYISIITKPDKNLACSFGFLCGVWPSAFALKLCLNALKPYTPTPNLRFFSFCSINLRCWSTFHFKLPLDVSCMLTDSPGQHPNNQLIVDSNGRPLSHSQTAAPKETARQRRRLHGDSTMTHGHFNPYFKR